MPKAGRCAEQKKKKGEKGGISVVREGKEGARVGLDGDLTRV